MAKKSIYETSFAAGHTGGLYEADLQGVGDVWSDIESSRAMTATKGERRERTLDTILAATELTSQVAGGLEARQEFKSSLKAVGADIDPSGETSFEKVKVGGLKKLFQEPSYKIGDKVMSKADITTAGQMLQYGGSPKYDRFKFEPENMAEEVGGFYGERKGFDIGDIVGEKSIFAGGKRKLSSVLSSAGEKLSSLKPKREPQVGAGTVLRPDQKLEAKQQKLEEVPSPSKDYPKAQRGIEKIEKKRAKKGDLPWEEEEGFLEWGMKYGG